MDEFRQIVKDALIMYSYDNDSQAINMTSEVSQDLLAEAIEDKIKAKFYVFRINKIITGDSPKSDKAKPANAEKPVNPDDLSEEEQMALYEKGLKETDWGHQPS